MNETVVTAGLVVVGDEILSGRTRDVNIATTAQFCTDLGIELREVRVVADEIDAIVEAVNAVRERYTYVFTTGGIGPTHDDITADAIAKAFGVDLPINEQARAMLEARWAEMGTEPTPARLRMARVPVGGELIVNGVTAAPGFRIGNVHVMAGVPKIMQAMLEAIAPTLKGGRKVESRSVPAGVGEGAIGDPLAEIQSRYPDVKIGSYPQMGHASVMTFLVMRSHDMERLEAATAEVQALVDRLHAQKNIVLPKEPYA
ncbi:competence/damage-inducible protein A [Pelagibacterium sp. 26DY04]|uniref:competence/damage-inducible protein A n=1 Tax=Pelagibacterium sp. 26DY04 TaxID=2967130 RepID=UPI002815191A|nr:competence/damage-inducible protein A [Pelagibacterium sp. 26DY04]WMT85666.1 competence/damage-inducible protein A [Pelagibacterium sp. 26DY04]